MQKKQDFLAHNPIGNRARIDNKPSLEGVEERGLKPPQRAPRIKNTSLNPLALFPGAGFSVMFRLLLVERICRRRMALFCRKNYGLESNLFLILLAASEGHLQQGILADSLGINKNAMVFLIDNLEARRLIKRVPNPDNRREKFVECTPRGKQIIADTKAHYPEIARWGFYPLTEIQIEQLRILLTQIIEGVQPLPCPLVRLKKTQRMTAQRASAIASFRDSAASKTGMGQKMTTIIAY